MRVVRGSKREQESLTNLVNRVHHRRAEQCTGQRAATLLGVDHSCPLSHSIGDELLQVGRLLRLGQRGDLHTLLPRKSNLELFNFFKHLDDKVVVTMVVTMVVKGERGGIGREWQEGREEWQE